MTTDDRSSLMRLLDANLNRAAEGLRVVEDVCRFHWDAPKLAARFKQRRHALFDALDGPELSRLELCAHRDVEGDVRRGSSSVSIESADLGVVACRNLSRVREAVRVLEEGSRGAWPTIARALEQLRYELYVDERAVLDLAASGEDRRSRLQSARVYLVAVPELAPDSFSAVVGAALAGGVDIVQLRVKEGTSDRKFLDQARELRELTARAGALFIVNDRPDLAVLAHADGVHVGQKDLPIGAVRRVVGTDLLVGISTHSVEQAVEAELAGADYIGVGPVYPTTTKARPEPLLGVEGLAAVLAQVAVPAFAIGGVSPERAVELQDVGCQRVAVAGAILKAAAPEAAAQALVGALIGEP